MFNKLIMILLYIMRWNILLLALFQRMILSLPIIGLTWPSTPKFRVSHGDNIIENILILTLF